MPARKPPLAGMMYAKVENFTDSAANSSSSMDIITDDLGKANVITSMTAANVTRHKVVVDLDLPATLVPSSTPGHFHLYIDHEMTTKQYYGLLDAMVEAGLVEKGFVEASKVRGYTAARLPWVKKTKKDREHDAAKKKQRELEATTSPF